MEQALTVEEEKAIREAAYNGEATPEIAVAPEAVIEEPNPTPDPWAGVPTALRSQIEMISGKLTSLDTIENRLKQTEKRLGGIQNDFYNAQKKAAEAPTKVELEKAAKSSEAWENLKAEFPDWAEAIEGKIAEKNANIPDIESLRTKVTELGNGFESIKQTPDLEVRLVGLIHPNFREIIKSSEYLTWLKTQPLELQRQAEYGKTADEAVDVLNRFKESKPKTISNKDRLEQAVELPKGPKPKVVKSPEEMSEAEIRQQIQKELWG